MQLSAAFQTIGEHAEHLNVEEIRNAVAELQVRMAALITPEMDDDLQQQMEDWISKSKKVGGAEDSLRQIQRATRIAKAMEAKTALLLVPPENIARIVCLAARNVKNEYWMAANIGQRTQVFNQGTIAFRNMIATILPHLPAGEYRTSVMRIEQLFARTAGGESMITVDKEIWRQMNDNGA